jgi:hypothetical protein
VLAHSKRRTNCQVATTYGAFDGLGAHRIAGENEVRNLHTGDGIYALRERGS